MLVPAGDRRARDVPLILVELYASTLKDKEEQTVGEQCIHYKARLNSFGLGLW